MDSQDEETEYCTNCKRDIPSNNYVMHHTHCVRNIVLCKKCDEPVPRSEMEAHNEEYHVLEFCECGESIEREQLPDHKENHCKLRKVKCEYCELDLPFEKIREHCDFCGSRTEKCPKCNKFVKLRDQVMHDLSECQINVQESSMDSLQGRSSTYYRSRFSPTKKTATEYTSGISGGTMFSYQQLNRPTMMEELDSDRMVGVRRSSKNERLQRQHKKNERTVQNSHSLRLDESDSISTTKQQEEDDYLFALRLASNIGDDLSQFPREVEADIAPVVPSVPWTFDPTTNRQLSKDSQTGFREDGGTSDLSQIPCEFCDKLIASSELLDHQEQCLLWYGESPGHTNRVPEVNDEMLPFRPLRPRGVPFDGPDREPAILDPDLNFNNLRDSPSLRMPPTRPYSMENGLQPRSVMNQEGDRLSNHHVGGNDDTMVPCEFCEAQLPFESISFHQAVCESAPQQSLIFDDMREYQFDSLAPELEYPQVVRPSGRSSPLDVFEDFPSDSSFRNTPKHQPAPDLNWIWKTEEPKVGIVSREKTVNMLQNSASQTSNGHVRRRETALPSNSSPLVQSHSSAFVRPKVNIVSKEKTQKIYQQQKFKKRNVPESSSVKVQSSATPGSLSRRRNVPSGSTNLNTNHGNKNKSPTDFQLSSEVIRSTRGIASRGVRHNSNLARDALLLGDYEEDELQNVVDGTSQSPPRVQRERTWEEILTNMKLDKINKKIDNDTIQQEAAALREYKSPQTSRADSRQKLNRNALSTEDILLNNGTVASDLSPLNQKKSAKSKSLAQRNDVSVLGKSLKEQGSSKSTVYTAHKTSQKSMSSSNLSSRVTLPQSTRGKKSSCQQFPGASQCAPQKKDNSEVLQSNTTGGQSRKPGKPAQPHMDVNQDFLNQIIADTNRKLATGNQSNSERSEKSGRRSSSQVAVGQQQSALERQGRKPRSANIVANFPEENNRPRREGRPSRRGSHSRGAGQRGCRNYRGCAD